MSCLASTVLFARTIPITDADWIELQITCSKAALMQMRRPKFDDHKDLEAIAAPDGYRVLIAISSTEVGGRIVMETALFGRSCKLNVFIG